MQVYTIGFTKRTAAEFFGQLRGAGIRRLVDVRLANSSQLAGFAKAQDLGFFLEELCNAEYRHEPLLAPTEELLRDYRKKAIGWPEYEQRFRALMVARQVERTLARDLFDVTTVLLCSEPRAERCHRRLALEYLQENGGRFTIVHL